MKRITYNRENKDFDMYLDSQYIGSRPTRLEAETHLDALVYEQMTRSHADYYRPTRALLAGGQG